MADSGFEFVFYVFCLSWRLVAGKVRSAIELLYQGTVLLQCLGVLNQGAQAAEDKKCHCLSRSELWRFLLATKLIPLPDPARCGRIGPWQRHYAAMVGSDSRRCRCSLSVVRRTKALKATYWSDS
jgi:hypothetical protein